MEKLHIQVTRRRKKYLWFIILNILGVLSVAWHLLIFSNSQIFNYIDILGIFFLIIMGILLWVAGQRSKHVKVKLVGLFSVIFWLFLSIRLDYYNGRYDGLINIIIFGHIVFVLKTAWDNYDDLDLRREYLQGIPVVIMQKEEKTKQSEQPEQPKEISKTEEIHQADKVPKEESSVRQEADIGLIDVNGCSAEKLATLPGISIVTAKKMIEIRNQQGGFHSVDEFVMKSGIKPHFATDIIKRLTISVNTDSHMNKTKGRKLDI